MFSSSFDAATISNNTLKIFKDGVLVPITTPNTYANTVEFNTQSPLEAGANYSLVVDGVKSATGDVVAKKTIAFKSATETVVRTVVVTDTAASAPFNAAGTLYNPGYNAVASVTGTWSNTANSFAVTLDESVDKTTLTSSTVKLHNLTTGKYLAVEATAVTNVISVKITGQSDFLTPKSQYELVLDGVKAANGNAVEKFNLQFSYQDAQPAV